MPKSDAKRRADNKWSAANMTIVACKVRKTKADAFRAACQATQTTPNAVLLQTVNDFLAAPVKPPDALLSPSAIVAAEAAAAMAGEDVISFLERAISTQAALDLEHLRESRSESRSDSGKVDGKVAEPV